MYRRPVSRRGKGFSNIFKKVVSGIAKTGVKKLTSRKNLKRLVSIGKKTILKNPALKKSLKSNATKIISKINTTPKKSKKQRKTPSLSKKVLNAEIKKLIAPTRAKLNPPRKGGPKINKKNKKKKFSSTPARKKTKKLLNDTVRPMKGWRRINNTDIPSQIGSGIVLD